jgi:MFS family permease
MFRAEYPENETLQNMYGFIYGLIFFCSMISGFGNALLWVTQGAYVAKCSDESNAGMFNGVFWVMFMSSQIVGNFLGAFVIANVGQI